MNTHAGSEPRGWLVLGGDIGGTSTRILVAGSAGTPLRLGTAGGGNPVSHPDTAAAALGAALRDALTDVDPIRVRAAVVGMAGGSALRRPEVAQAFRQVWSDNGLRCAPTYVTDLEVAFAAGTAEPSGTVLIAGTGAVAGELRDRRLVRTADGHGWLLGDDGSGFWLGREAARATLRTLDVGVPPGPLAASVLRELGAPPVSKTSSLLTDQNEQRIHLIHVLNSRPPVRLAELAPLVAVAFGGRDGVAEGIVEEAARLLAGTVGRVRQRETRTPIVLAGSLARADSPVGAKLREMVTAQHLGAVFSAHNGVGGAAWLALAAADAGAATGAARIRLTETLPSARSG